MTAISDENFGVWGKFWSDIMKTVQDIAYYTMQFQKLVNYISNDT